jgi:hypothetical protein
MLNLKKMGVGFSGWTGLVSKPSATVEVAALLLLWLV